MSQPCHNNFRARLLNGDCFIGTFIKTPSMTIAEVLAQSELEVFCFDAEHAPFDRAALDACLYPCRANGKPSLVRVPTAKAEHLLTALDCGATGVLIPHVNSGECAMQVCQHALYGKAGRGYAGSTRAAGYGTKTIPSHIEDTAKDTVIIAQIEDMAGVDAIEDIAKVERLDCLFIGMVDLTVSLGAPNAKDSKVVECANMICHTAQKYQKRLGMFTPYIEDIAFWQTRGVSLFLLESEHRFIQAGARRLAGLKPHM